VECKVAGFLRQTQQSPPWVDFAEERFGDGC
jgi:hypothetical protein